MEAFQAIRAMLERAREREGTLHRIGPKRLNGHVQEFAGKHIDRDPGTLAQMTAEWRGWSASG